MWNRFKRILPENSRQSREEISQRITWGHWFALFNIVLSLLISARYAFNADWPNTLFGKLYFFISLFGHFSFVVFAGYLLCLFPLSFAIKNNRIFRSISVIIATIGMTVLLVDTEVFKQFYLHLSPLVWDLLVNPDEAELSRQWQLLFVPMPLILLLEMLYSRWCWNKLRSFMRQRWGKNVALFFVSCFIATHLFYAWADMAIYRPITAQRANYPLAYPMTARTFLEKHGLLDRSEFTQTIQQQGRLDTFYLNYPKHPLHYQPKANPINLLFINLSGLNSELISAENMPTLTEISRHSRQFTQHYSGGDNINGGIASLFYGISGRYVDAILNEQESSVFINTLQKYHYQFGLFSHNGFAEPIYHRALFKDFSLPETHSNLTAIHQWKTWLIQRNNQPFFSYLALNLPKISTKEQQAKTADWQLKQIWTTLAEQNLLKNTLILITADIATQDIHSTTNSFDANRIKVPMFIYWQGDSGRYTHLSSHLDIVPTLLNQFFGVNSPINNYSQGINLTQPNERRWLLSANYKWDVAIMPNGEQYHINHKGDFVYYDEQGKPQKNNRPPLALFLQLIQQSNQFVEK